MSKFAINMYTSQQTYTPGWEVLYEIQPMQAFCNSDIDIYEDFVEEIKEEMINSVYLEDVDPETINMFCEELSWMNNNVIGWLALERKIDEEVE